MKGGRGYGDVACVIFEFLTLIINDFVFIVIILYINLKRDHEKEIFFLMNTLIHI